MTSIKSYMDQNGIIWNGNMLKRVIMSPPAYDYN